MPRHALALTLAVLLTTTVVSAGQAPTPARIVVKLPADAELYVDDVRFTRTGATRTIETPPLEPGERYSYTLRAVAERGGRTVSASKKIAFRAGETTRVDFGELRPAGEKAVKAEPGALRLSKDEQAVLDLVNEERQKAGLTPLRPSALLFRAARDHAANMASQDRLAHELDGKGPGERLQELGYRSFGWGENVAGGQRTPREAMESWLASEGHRANILNADFRELGVGLAPGPNGGRYWTQVFGRPADR